MSAGAGRDSARTRDLHERTDDGEQLREQTRVMADAVHAADQAKSNFLATVSHELRTPLTALTGYSELLADEILGPLTPLQRDTIERMRSVMHHLTVMIDEILTFSSLEARSERVTLTDVSPARVMQAAASVVEPLAHKKGVGFLLQTDDTVPPLQSDEDKIVQILVNLAGNAVKFTDNGEVRFTLAGSGDEVHFIVADTGIGIAESDLTRLFQPFSQMDTSLTRRHGGNGLGLYISSRLATLLGGRIEVKSTPNIGSIFTLILQRKGGGGGDTRE